MAVVAQLLNPRVLARLSESQLATLAAALNAEVLTNPTIRKVLEDKASALSKEMERTLKGD
jgi:hypothetical protein